MSAQSKASRRLEFSEGSSNKFWNIDLDGSAFTVTYGRIGASGQTQTKEFDNDADARKAYDKLVTEKTKKGYTDTSGVTPVSSKSSSFSSAAPAAVESTTKGIPSGRSKS